MKTMKSILAGLVISAALSQPAIAQLSSGTAPELSSGKTTSGPVSWATAGPDEFSPMIGQTFHIVTADNQKLDLKLSEIIAGSPDADRPAYLSRDRSVIVVFAPEQSVQDYFRASGSQNVSVWHPRLGQSTLHISPVAQEDGSLTVEIALN